MLLKPSVTESKSMFFRNISRDGLVVNCPNNGGLDCHHHHHVVLHARLASDRVNGVQVVAERLAIGDFPDAPTPPTMIS